jgi:hypothetical protein
MQRKLLFIGLALSIMLIGVGITFHICMDKGKMTKLTEKSPDAVSVVPFDEAPEGDFYSIPDIEAEDGGKNDP